MSLLSTIQADALAARKAREADRGVFLSTLFAEASKVGKDAGNRESSDAEVIAVIKKFAKNNEEALQALAGSDADEVRRGKRDKLMLERDWLAGYLPTQASEAEVSGAIKDVLATLAERSPKQMGAVMAALQARFNGNFDKGTASRLVKAALSA